VVIHCGVIRTGVRTPSESLSKTHRTEGPLSVTRADLRITIDMKFYWLVLGILSVWRITSLIGSEDGPWDVFAKLRTSVGDGFFAKGLACFYCLSLWVALPFGLILGESWTERLLLWLALSAGAIVIQRVTRSADAEAPALYFEDKEN